MRNIRVLGAVCSIAGGVLGQAAPFGSQQVIPTSSTEMASLATGDLNGDGEADLLYTSQSAGALALAWRPGDGAGSFGPAQIIEQPSIYIFWNAEVHDLDMDGDLDVLATMGPELRAYINDGSGSFTSVGTIYSDPCSVRNMRHDTGDVDGDGDLDILVVTNDFCPLLGNFCSDCRVLFNDGAGGFGNVSNNLVTGGLPSQVAAADVNGDSHLDIVIGSQFGGIDYLLGDGAGSFGSPQAVDTVQVARLLVEDIDGDGDVDITVSCIFNDAIEYWLNDGAGAFGAPEPIISLSAVANGLELVDVDLDGDPDLVTAAVQDGTVAWLENTGSATFGPQQVLTNTAAGVRDVAAADLDNDGDVEVVTAASSSGELLVFDNETLGIAGVGCGGLVLSAGPMQLGASWDLQLDGIPGTSSFALFVFGDTAIAGGAPLGISLCTAYSSGNLGYYTEPVTAGVSSYSVPIPNNPIYLGYKLAAQGATSSSSPNAHLGLAFSNGLTGIVTP